KHAIRHLRQAFVVLGVPQTLKTDNGPCFIAARMRDFLQVWGVSHITGIAHSSTGQALVECANQT
ncbi:POK10 protein, partial [Bucorvus abyssinicus]|nr:POK10 protein [Bucorvus abyssinicus]